MLQLKGLTNFCLPNIYKDCDWFAWQGESHSNPQFNESLYTLYNPVEILDLGCGGGGFVENCVKDGYLAVGVEGFNRYVNKRANSWANIPFNLFIYNIACPFTIYNDDKLVLFNVVTAWEVLEHISRECIDGVVANIYNNLQFGGIFIGTVSTLSQDGHLIVESVDWWKELFKKHGLIYTPDVLDVFHGNTIRMDCKTTSHFICFTKQV